MPWNLEVVGCGGSPTGTAVRGRFGDSCVHGSPGRFNELKAIVLLAGVASDLCWADPPVSLRRNVSRIQSAVRAWSLESIRYEMSVRASEKSTLMKWGWGTGATYAIDRLVAGD